MQETNQNIVNLIIVGSIFLVLLGGGIVMLVSLFSKARRAYFLEKRHMQQQFEQEILTAQLEIQENTFKNISEEIHDNVGQLLSLAKVQLNIIESTGQLDRTLLADIKEGVGKAMSDLRDIAKSMSGERMQHIGLETALENEMARINRTNSIQAIFERNGQPIKISQQKQLIIFRITQEVIQNIFKHANARQINLRLNYLSNNIEIEIADDGIGFNLSGNESEGLGLQNIRNRAALIGGEAIISSIPGSGTTIKLTVPNE